MSRIGYLAAVLCAAPLMGTAAESAAEVARRCSQVIGERERLACYDRAFPAGPQTSGLAENRAPAGAAPAATPAAAPAAAPAPPAAASFGEESIRKPVKAEDRAARPREPETLTAQITAIREMRPQVWRLTLDNGQVWQQMDMSGGFLPKAGNTLRIEKGRFGGYSAALMGETRSTWVRVTRVQ